MASMVSPTTCLYLHKHRIKLPSDGRRLRITASIPDSSDEKHPKLIARREMILRSSELAMIGAIFQLSGKKPDYIGVQKNERLALCPATNNCISTSESVSDRVHYAPPWNYNGGRKTPVSREVAMKELVNVIKSTKPDKFTPRIVEKKDDYVHVEYESPILGLVDDVEFLFSPGKNSTVEYRSASRKGNFDFDVNRKRIKALRQELEKKGWESENSF
ncbi:Uncharacterized protein Rs2_23092 [Raphanus sativus]|uniref:Uncharacterized protein LOC108856698 isoform X1 n=2 Tax=Raphanus sativus TaxID=3726 RepID=A0A6J0NN26_RAPSA|nr:uncharacterized protein LOC108856698 isoform X1 [Raphanus sativus]KAJ4896298.1 Uncharacterized protein Rs2_23092 [Raphanus sativus]